MSLFFNMPSMGSHRAGHDWSDLAAAAARFVITFLPGNKHLLISWLQSLSSVILEPKKIKSATVFTSYPSICHEVMGLYARILVFWMLSFKPDFSFSSFILIKRLISSLPSAFRVVSSAYLSLLIFLLAVLLQLVIPPSQRLVWCTLHVRHTPFPILNQSLVPCPVLTVASWPAYRFDR